MSIMGEARGFRPRQARVVDERELDSMLGLTLKTKACKVLFVNGGRPPLTRVGLGVTLRVGEVR